jgi:hypothetical protein
MKNLRFCLLYAAYNQGKEGEEEVNRLGSMHPQRAMAEMGITYQHSTPQSMGDQWWFWNCEGVPAQLPPFLEVMENDPMDCVGHGLSQEDAEAIRDYSATSQEQK